MNETTSNTNEKSSTLTSTIFNQDQFCFAEFLRSPDDSDDHTTVTRDLFENYGACSSSGLGGDALSITAQSFVIKLCFYVIILRVRKKNLMTIHQ
jgi:hypothetical protein